MKSSRLPLLLNSGEGVRCRGAPAGGHDGCRYRPRNIDVLAHPHHDLLTSSSVSPRPASAGLGPVRAGTANYACGPAATLEVQAKREGQCRKRGTVSVMVEHVRRLVGKLIRAMSHAAIRQGHQGTLDPRRQLAGSNASSQQKYRAPPSLLVSSWNPPRPVTRTSAQIGVRDSRVDPAQSASSGFTTRPRPTRRRTAASDFLNIAHDRPGCGATPEKRLAEFEPDASSRNAVQQ